MSRSEEAWKPVGSRWHPHEQWISDSDAVKRLKSTIRELQKIRLPVQAIALIGHAIRYAEQIALETGECPACGTRLDGMVNCNRCREMFDISEVDSISGNCLACEDELEDEYQDQSEEAQELEGL